MTHRDGFPRLSARSAWRGDAGHRKPRATPPESLGKPPFRSRRRTAGGRRKALPMSRIARGFPPTRRIARPISMGHYQRSLVYRCRQLRANRERGGGDGAVGKGRSEDRPRHAAFPSLIAIAAKTNPVTYNMLI